MAVHDTNLGGDMSVTPMPIIHNAVDKRMADGTTSITNKVGGDDTGPRVITRDAQIIVNDGTRARIILGLLPDSSYGLVISKKGVDAFDVFD